MDNDCHAFPLSRRVALTQLAAAGLGVGLAVQLMPVAAQDATPAVTGVPPAVQEFMEALGEFDLDRLVAAFAEDGTFTLIPTGVTSEGRDAIRQQFMGFLSAFTDPSLNYTSMFGTGTWAAGEWVLSGVYSQTLPGLPPADGQPLTFQGVHIFELSGDQIQAVREYFDFFGILVQLGAIPAPASATPA